MSRRDKISVESVETVISYKHKCRRHNTGNIHLFTVNLSEFLQPPLSPFFKGDLVAVLLRQDFSLFP